MNFTKRFIAAAIAFVMVLSMLPAGILTASAASTTYTFDAAAELTGSDKAAVTGTFGDYFTIGGSGVTMRTNSSGVYCIELPKKAAGTVDFTVVGTADVTISAASTGSTNRSDIVLMKDGAIVTEGLSAPTADAVADGVVTVYTSGTYTEITYTGLTSGTYSVAAPTTGNGASRNTRVKSIVVVDNVVDAGCEHDWVAGDAVAPNCTEEGYTEYTCSLCQSTKKEDAVPANGHTWDEENPVLVEPNCTEGGYYEYTCTVCQATKQEFPLDPLGHTMGEVSTVAPTCLTPGYDIKTCEVCGVFEVSNEVAALGHELNAETGACVRNCGWCEHAVDGTYTFNAADVSAPNTAGTYGHFSLVIAESPAEENKLATTNGEDCLYIGKNGSSKLTFTVTSDVSTVVIRAASTGGSNASAIKLYHEEYEMSVNPATPVVYATWNEVEYPTVSTTTATDLVFANLTPGTYSISSPETKRGFRLVSVELKESVSVDGACVHNPISLNSVMTMNPMGNAGIYSIEIPAGATYSFEFNPRFSDWTLTVNGEAIEPVIEGGLYSFTIANDGDAAATYEIMAEVKVVIGTMDNPEVITDIDVLTANVPAGAADGYNYLYTADFTGTLELMLGTIEPEGVVGDLLVVDGNWNMLWLADAENGIISVPVTEGDELSIAVWAMDEAGEYVEGTVKVVANKVYPVGSEQNPINLNAVMTWNPAHTAGSYTAEIPAGETWYFTLNPGFGEYDMTVNSVEFMPDRNDIGHYAFSLTNETDAAAAYVIAAAVHVEVGTWNNPEELTDETVKSFVTTITEENPSPYYWVYTPAENGILTLTIADIVEEGYLADIVVNYDQYFDNAKGASIDIPVEAGTPYVFEIAGHTADAFDVCASTITITGSFVKVLTPAEIVDLAYALETGTSTTETYTLTGKITAIKEYNDYYGNATCTIVIEGREDYPITCYRMKAGETTAEAIKDLWIGDTITVTGVFTNYNGSIQFNSGCTLDNVVKNAAPTTVEVSFVVPQGVAPVASMNVVQESLLGIALPVAEAPEKHTFVGWATAPVEDSDAVPTVFKAGEDYRVTDAATLYAVYSYEVEQQLSGKVWSLVTDASALKAGDKVIIAYNDANAVANAEVHKNGYLTVGTAAFSSDKGTIITVPETAGMFTLGGDATGWTLADGNGQLLGTTGSLKLAWDSGVTTWTIAITDGVARITNTSSTGDSTDTYGFIQFNTSSPRFKNYKTTSNMKDPQLYAEVEKNETITTNRYTSVGAGDPFAITDVSMNLGNSLTMYFKFPAANVVGSDNVAVITKNYADGRDPAVTEVAQKDWAVEGELYSVAVNNIAAKEMSDIVSVVIKDANGNAISEVKNSSVRAYAMMTLNTSSNAKLLTLMAELLNYGAAAQNQFGYGTSDLANAKMNATHQSYATADTSILAPKANRGDAIKVQSFNMVLESNLMLNLKYYPADVTQDMTAKVSYTTHAGTVTSYEIAGSEFEMGTDGYMWVCLSTLAAADINTEATVEIISNGEVISTTLINMAVAVAIDNGATPAMTAMSRYCVAAYNYFH